MHLDAVRTVVAVAEAGQFRDAALDLGVTQQAVSKRIAAVETELGVRLFVRTPRGAELTADGQAFLPHAREALDAMARAIASVRTGGRALRIDVFGRRLAPADLLQAFHRAHPDVELEVVTLPTADRAVEAVRAGRVDAAFRAVAGAPDGLVAVRVLDEPLELLTGPDHPLAGAGELSPTDLAGHRIWVPGLVDGAEWTAYYAAFAAAFGLTIDADGPNFGREDALDRVGASASLATIGGAGLRVDWSARPTLRRIVLRRPTPIYPWSLVYRAGTVHPGLTALRKHLGSPRVLPDSWTPWPP
ncbi:LysR substrate-binding domain-containing protein [Cryptosporangium minutisporangium]|uniref:LysR family transcriptional regulator n=1 Tax=Cryptosporangium minutisporangium TaxID=113569 RepID=A0ABP6T399_9ACTN